MYKQGISSLPSRENAVTVKPHTMRPNYGLVREDKKMNVVPVPGLSETFRGGFARESGFHVQLKPESVKLRKTC